MKRRKLYWQLCSLYVHSSAAFNRNIKEKNEDRKADPNTIEREDWGQGAEWRERARGSGGCPESDTSQTANPKEFYSISLESFCFKVKSITKEPSPDSNSSKHCSVPIYSPNHGSEGQQHTHIHTHTSGQEQVVGILANTHTHTLTHFCSSASTLIL